ncbi:MAG: phosphate acyltransferase PlsX [Holosporales bacterium]|jgi:glycerol-3-phosphate acyltransferase PlsX|nr:phosphate acyltransferase PlsX [Holosporales bacterium]
MIRIALDVMGGDKGVESNITGILHCVTHNKYKDVNFDLFGNKPLIDAAISKVSKFPMELCEIHDTGERTISSDDRPSMAIKRGGGTSMFEAISHVALGRSDAVVSSGNTGAYMALSKIIIGMMAGIDRPAIVSIIPNIKGRSVMLDLGANTCCSSTQLVQFAVMGLAIAQVMLGVQNPSVALLNIGTERSKGTEVLDEAYKVLARARHIKFTGFIEGTDIMAGTSDVIVTDGFPGNISLKTIEGTIKYLTYLTKNEIENSFMCKIGYLFCRRMVSSIKDALDPRQHNGAPFVGLKKIAVKSHGNSDAIGFSKAISAAIKLANSDFIQSISRALSTIKPESPNENSHK